MKKKYYILLWLLLPLPVVVLHFGRGQQYLARDKAHACIVRAQALEKQENWQEADRWYRDAAKCLGAGEPAVKLRLDLAQVRTRYRQGDAVAAMDQMDKVVNDTGFSAMPVEYRREARELAGRIHYYAGWVMRLEGARRELWMEEAELARQNFRLLTEQSASEGAKDYATKQQTNLESAVLLQRMSLYELMAKPLPEEGQQMGGQGLSEQMGKRRGQRGKGKQPGIGEGDEDKPAPGAGTQRFQPGSGS
ncbi:MAG: hypothetical protein NTW21_20270 [Verrucomicrobia bacterium]|nr:hypothetical protein [Verrucomicrobiota bacterium]